MTDMFLTVNRFEFKSIQSVHGVQVEYDTLTMTYNVICPNQASVPFPPPTLSQPCILSHERSILELG